MTRLVAAGGIFLLLVLPAFAQSEPVAPALAAIAAHESDEVVQVLRPFSGQPIDRSVERRAGGFVAQGAPRPDPVVFDNGNIYTVYTQPTSAPIVRLERRTRITAITTYHWNDGRGADPGSIALVDAHGRLYGPWPADGSVGQGGVHNAYWTVRPNLTLPAGRYIVIDSDLASWAHNEATGGAGMVHIEGRVR